MGGADLISTLTGEGDAAVFVVVDDCSGECLGVHAARWANRFEALEPLRQAVHHSFGAFCDGVAAGTKLRHDHDSHFVADDFQAELDFLGLMSASALICREPEGNGCVDRFIPTLKENLLSLQRFDTIEYLRRTVHALKEDYKQRWIVQRHGYRTPGQVQTEQTDFAVAA